MKSVHWTISGICMYPVVLDTLLFYKWSLHAHVKYKTSLLCITFTFRLIDLDFQCEVTADSRTVAQ